MKFVPVPITGGPTSGQRVLFSIWETRVQDYEVFCNETNRRYNQPAFAQDPMHPATTSWDDGQAFCAWLTSREHKAKKIGSNEAYRLPTDHEWSCAVGIGDREDSARSPREKSGLVRDVYPWGKSWPPMAGVGNIPGIEAAAEVGKYPMLIATIASYGDDYVMTAPVGSFPPNAWGLFDLCGNLWEWVEDWLAEPNSLGVLRGGSWATADARACLSSHRQTHLHSLKLADVGGFRCVLASAVPSSASSNTGSAKAAVPAQATTPAPLSAPRASVAPATPIPRPASAAGNRADAALANATKDAPFVNSLGMKFVPVPGTKVLFCIHETRRQDYAAYAAAVPGVDGSWQTAKQEGVVPAGHEDNHPVVAVNRAEAQAFCAWLSAKEAKIYWLPTDREWSYAVGIGHEERWTKDTTPESLSEKIRNEYPWGTKWPPPNGSVNYADTTWHDLFPNRKFIEGYTDGFATTAPVMSFKPNKLGIYDLGGNVSEWVSDWRNADQKEGVLRGGSFSMDGATWLLSSARRFHDPEVRSGAVSGIYGFRCVVELRGP